MKGILNTRMSAERTELPGRCEKLKQVWKMDGGLIRDDLNAKQEQFVFDFLLGAYQVKYRNYKCCKSFQCTQ